LRVADYRFYGNLCVAFGIVFISIGVALPILTAQVIRYAFDLFPPTIRFPYLIHGIVLACIGVGFIVAAIILLREHKIRKREEKQRLNRQQGSH